MTDQERMKTAETIYIQLEILMSNLWNRWQDEKEYEDFEEYKKVVNKALIKYGALLTKMTKSPFAFTYSLSNAMYVVTIGARKYSYKRIA